MSLTYSLRPFVEKMWFLSLVGIKICLVVKGTEGEKLVPEDLGLATASTIREVGLRRGEFFYRLGGFLSLLDTRR